MTERTSPAVDLPQQASPASPTRAIPAEPGWPARRPDAQPPLRGAFVFFGIFLPTLTLLVELLFHVWGEEIFDPIPSLFHVLMIALVPLSNALVRRRLHTADFRPGPWLQHLAAAACAVSVLYAIAFAPYAPYAVYGLIALGLGLLPLTPVLSPITTLRAWVKLPSDHGPKKFWPGFTAVFIALAGPFFWNLETHQLLERATDGTVEESDAAVAWLRRIGSESALREACYHPPSKVWQFDSRWRSASYDAEKVRTIYYRVTGAAYNTRPAPSSATLTGRRGWGVRNFDRNIGGEQVAGKVAGLTMETSRLEGKVDAAALTSYTEWTMVFKNIAADASEARAQIELPPGGVVSRLTLWVNGEPREAAFGTRAQVREAYREVAVVKRRDPVLVNTCGPDRILVQCFPVPPGGGAMKIRVGITAPLRLTDAHTAAVDWPRMIETNFEPAERLRHDARIEADAPFADGKKIAVRAIADARFNAEPALRLALADTARSAIADDPLDPDSVIRQTVAAVASPRPRKVVWIIDGSRAMASAWDELLTVAAPPDRAPDAIFFAGESVARWEPKDGPPAAWLRRQKCRGGCDNLPALEAALDAAGAEADAAIVWLHGPQPVELSPARSLIGKIAARGSAPKFFDVAVGAGPNRIAEQLETLIVWQRAMNGDTPAQRLASLLDGWSGRATHFAVKRERTPRAGAVANANRHVARLWAREEIERLRAEPWQWDVAEKLALTLQLVTPVSGAVVLETQEQYDRHGLKPVDPATVPVVPEPGTAALLLLGAGWLGSRRMRRIH